MPALAELLDEDQAAALTGLQVQLLTTPAVPEAQSTAAACPLCGHAPPVPAALFCAGEGR